MGGTIGGFVGGIAGQAGRGVWMARGKGNFIGLNSRIWRWR